MRPLEFFALALWASVMGLSASSWAGLLFDLLAYLSVACALLASFKAFQRDMARQVKG